MLPKVTIARLRLVIVIATVTVKAAVPLYLVIAPLYLVIATLIATVSVTAAVPLYLAIAIAIAIVRVMTAKVLASHDRRSFSPFVIATDGLLGF